MLILEIPYPVSVCKARLQADIQAGYRDTDEAQASLQATYKKADDDIRVESWGAVRREGSGR